MKLSVVIATLNRRERLQVCLQSLIAQSLPVADYEIVIAVDGSSDGTAEMLASIRDAGNLVVVERENSGPAGARNAGVREARGEIVLLLDDDLICEPDLLRAHLEMHAAAATPGVVFGRMIAEHAAFRELSEYYARLDAGGECRWPEDTWVGPNTSMPRRLFVESGGYDAQQFPRRGEDVEFGLRLWRKGVPFRYCGRAVTSHYWNKSARQAWIDDAGTGRSIVQLCRMYPEYRQHCGLAGLLSERSWKHYAAWLATILPIPVRLIGGERRIRATATLIGAKREAGSWHQLRGMMGRRLAVLLYHHIGYPAPGTEHLSLTVSPAKFRRQMRWLKWRGYTPVTPARWLGWCSRGEPLPRKPVILTFDDAFADIARYALPVLERYGFASCIFVISGQSAQALSWEGMPVMTVASLVEWKARGVEIGAHTQTHPDLTSLTDEGIADEAALSRQDLRNYGLDSTAFAYPYGQYDARVKNAVGTAFPIAFTCEEGLNRLTTDLLEQRRTMTQPNDTWVDFALRAAYGYSWLNRARARMQLGTRIRRIFGLAGANQV